MDDFSDPTPRMRAAASAPQSPDLDPALVAGAPDRSAPRLVRRGRAVRAGAASVSALAVVAVGALVVPGVLAPRAPLFTAAGSAGGGEAAAMSADAKMAIWVNYHYVAGSGLSGDGSRGTVYQLTRSGEPEAVLADVADAIGLDGRPAASTYSTPDYPSYVVGPEDGSGPSLTLSWSGTADWWYNDPTAYPEPVCTDKPLEGGAAGETYQDCVQPEIPASESQAPVEAEARTQAAALFAATGFEVAASDIRVTADSWQTLASANLEVGGTATALEYTVAWSPLGRIAWASGHSIDVVDRGEYDTVSPVAAVDRLADWRWFGAAGPDYAGNAVLYAADAGVARSSGSGSASSDAPASSEPTATPEPGVTEPGDPGDPGEVLPEPGDGSTASPVEPVEPTIEPEPMPEPMPTPETVTVTLDTAEPTLLLVWDADGNAWLVPGYAYEQPEQGFWTTVVSLVEGVIALPEPMPIEPLVDPAPSDPAVQ